MKRRIVAKFEGDSSSNTDFDSETSTLTKKSDSSWSSYVYVPINSKIERMSMEVLFNNGDRTGLYFGIGGEGFSVSYSTIWELASTFRGMGGFLAAESSVLKHYEANSGDIFTIKCDQLQDRISFFLNKNFIGYNEKKPSSFRGIHFAFMLHYPKNSIRLFDHITELDSENYQKNLVEMKEYVCNELADVVILYEGSEIRCWRSLVNCEEKSMVVNFYSEDDSKGEERTMEDVQTFPNVKEEIFQDLLLGRDANESVEGRRDSLIGCDDLFSYYILFRKIGCLNHSYVVLKRIEDLSQDEVRRIFEDTLSIHTPVKTNNQIKKDFLIGILSVAKRIFKTQEEGSLYEQLLELAKSKSIEITEEELDTVYFSAQLLEISKKTPILLKQTFHDVFLERCKILYQEHTENFSIEETEGEGSTDLVNNELILISNDGKRFKFDLDILALKSFYIMKMVSFGGAETNSIQVKRELEIAFLDAKLLKMYVQFMYTDSILEKVEFRDIFQLLKQADMFEEMNLMEYLYKLFHEMVVKMEKQEVEDQIFKANGAMINQRVFPVKIREVLYLYLESEKVSQKDLELWTGIYCEKIL